MPLLSLRFKVIILMLDLLQFLSEFAFSDFDVVVFQCELGLASTAHSSRFLAFCTLDADLLRLLSHKVARKHITNFAKACS